MKQRCTLAITLAASFLLLGCHSVRRGEPITGLVPLRDADTRQGQLVFMQHCHQCHPFGQGGLGPALNDKPAPRFLMKTQVRLGLGVMPSFTKQEISPEELDNLMDYIIALRKADSLTR